MGFCRLIRTTFWGRVLRGSSETRYRRSTALLPLGHSRQMKRASFISSKRVSRLSIILFGTAICLLLSIFSVAIWIHADLLANTGVSDCPHVNSASVSRNNTAFISTMHSVLHVKIGVFVICCIFVKSAKVKKVGRESCTNF